MDFGVVFGGKFVLEAGDELGAGSLELGHSQLRLGVGFGLVGYTALGLFEHFP